MRKSQVGTAGGRKWRRVCSFKGLDGSPTREVWNGSELSKLAIAPLYPVKLPNPLCLLDMEVFPNEQLFFSKRDIHTCFDMLKVPEGIQPWFGRPAVSIPELLEATGWHRNAILHYVRHWKVGYIEDITPLYPISVAWPMGFSWSSCISQACVVECCRRAGVRNDCFMCMDQPMPLNQLELCGVATDDTICIHKNSTIAASRLDR